MRMLFGQQGRLKEEVLDHLLRAEPGIRRHRDRVLLSIVVMMAVIAAADVRLWPGISLAFGYSFPVALGAYALGIRSGVGLSVVAVVLRAAFAGRTYGPWWLYAGSAFMLAEYLLLAFGVGLLGRAIARLERQTRVLRHLNEFGRNLAAMRDPDRIWPAAVEGAVRLTGADGGFIATQHGMAWRAAAVFHVGGWSSNPVIFLGEAGASRHVDGASDEDSSWRPLDAPIHIGVELVTPGGGPARQLVVFRALHGPFTAPTVDVLKLAALHVSTALQIASAMIPPADLTASHGSTD